MNRNLSFALLLLFVVSSLSVYAQPPSDIYARTDVDLRLWPFIHGVASGDPLSDRVIIWTRVTPYLTTSTLEVDWEIATDTGMTAIVQSGMVNTDSTTDFTVKIDVTGLDPNTWYYYRFYSGDRKSLTGRTRTAPVGDVDSLRFAVVSCSDYVDGYFHGYREIAERNDIDAVLHLGDYIYENGSEGDLGRPHDPPKRITGLNDYRQRYSQYRLDHDLRCVHQMYPFINIWDDHEIANNSWKGGAEAHDEPGDGLWEHRKRMAVKAYYEWIPIRHPDPTDSTRIYRTLEWGDLLDLMMLDSRIIGRDSQVTGSLIDDPTRYMLGPDQLGWLSNEMESSTAQWKVIGQQVMMAPLIIPVIGTVATDSWDGYTAERNRFYDTVLTKNIENLVVLTGDIHTAWANNLESDSGAVGVEFIVSSVTTMNSPLPLPIELIQISNPHIKYANLDDHGYYILSVNKERTQADYYTIGNIDNPDEDVNALDASWYTDDSTSVLTEASGASPPRSDFPVLQPSKIAPNPVGIEDDLHSPSLTVIGTYPNPFWENFVIKTYLFKPGTISAQVFDTQGALIQEVEAGKLAEGLHYLHVDGNSLPKGMYVVKLQAGEEVFVRRVMKI